jgi:hypothetical protein
VEGGLDVVRLILSAAPAVVAQLGSHGRFISLLCFMVVHICTFCVVAVQVLAILPTYKYTVYDVYVDKLKQEDNLLSVLGTVSGLHPPPHAFINPCIFLIQSRKRAEPNGAKSRLSIYVNLCPTLELRLLALHLRSAHPFFKPDTCEPLY